MNVDKAFVSKWLVRLTIGNYALLLVYLFLGLYADVLLIMSLLVFGTPLFLLFIKTSLPVKPVSDKKVTSELAQQILAEYRAKKQKASEPVAVSNVDHAYKELLEVFNGGDQ